MTVLFSPVLYVDAEAHSHPGSAGGSFLFLLYAPNKLMCTVNTVETRK